MPKLVISFKNNEEELKLYDEIIKHSDKSAYVKDALRGIINVNNTAHTPNIINNEEDDLLSQLANIKFGG